MYQPFITMGSAAKGVLLAGERAGQRSRTRRGPWYRETQIVIVSPAVRSCSSSRNPGGRSRWKAGVRSAVTAATSQPRQAGAVRDRPDVSTGTAAAAGA